MSETKSANDGPRPDENFTPEPAQKPKLYQVAILFIYHVVLGVVLAYLVYNVWPPQPWPGDTANSNKNSNSSNSQPAQNKNTANNNSATTTNANTNSGATTNANTGGAVNANSSPSNSNQSNSNKSAGGNANSGTTNNTNTGAANPNGAQTSNSGAADEKNEKQPNADEERPPKFSVFGKDFKPLLEVRLILLVMLVGAIGSYLHAASSFVDYLGNRTFVSSWVWWYLLRPFIGMLLALLFYFVFRGGFITAGNAQGNATDFINPFGIAAMAGLVGMFSKVATDKLNEVFTTLFRPAPGQGDAKRGDKLGPPTIASLDQRKGSEKGGTSVTITGANFGAGMKVLFGGTPAKSVTVISPTSINAVTPAHDPGTVKVDVINQDGQQATLPDAFTYEKDDTPPGQQPQPGQPQQPTKPGGQQQPGTQPKTEG
ncbi:MAG TPA: IPT/TIG domain-containing protein [Pyrinomonadaceae bacterium]|jgi:hypothetical protein